MAVVALYQTTIGKKAVMAITGLILVGFVILHMWGNLHAFEGPMAFNEYGHFLRVAGAPVLGSEQALWSLRVVLLIAAALHIVAAVQLTQRDLASRPIGYSRKRSVSGGAAALLMRASGVLLAVFIVVHILHFTTGTLLPGFRAGEVYANVVRGFSNPLMVLFYLVAMAALAFHLFHGIWSTTQTLGWNNRGADRGYRNLALAIATLVSLGFVAVPLAVLFGALH
jgi:succinate dehydrogenase / fumarate reductase cytochrome b subunit